MSEIRSHSRGSFCNINGCNLLDIATVSQLADKGGFYLTTF
jgi:hypothetical protein